MLAGVAGMDRRRFLLYNATGAAGWAAVMFGGGYWLGAITRVSSHLQLIQICAAAVSIVPGLTSVLRSRMARSSMA